MSEFNLILKDIVELMANRYPNIFTADLTGLEGIIAATPDIPYSLISDRLYAQRKMIRSLYNRESDSYNWAPIYSMKLDDHLQPGEKSGVVVDIFNKTMRSFRQLSEPDKVTIWCNVMKLLQIIKNTKY